MTPFLQTITPDQSHEIQQAALLILEKTGCQVTHPGALAMLKKAGAFVTGELVRPPRRLIEEALRTVPEGFMMYTAKGEPALDLTGRKSYFGSSTASPDQRHALTGERTPTTLQDIAWGAHVADALENIDFVMPFGSAGDVPACAAEAFEFEAVMGKTTKPLFFCGYSAAGVELVYDMATAVAGSKERLAARPFLAVYPEPITPLQFPADIVEKIRLSAERYIPQVICGAQFMGFTSPVTVAGSLALATAESFFGILLAQLFNEGAPCFFTSALNAGNMRNGLAFITSPEMTLGLAAQAQIAQSLGLPTWGLAGATDSKALDAQAGAESALDACIQALAGVNIIHDVGYMDMGMQCSCAMMVLGNEIIDWIKRFTQGITVSADTLATEVIDSVGPGGNFLVQKHTVSYMREEIWQPELFFKDSWARWTEEGSPALEQRADEKVREILNNHIPEGLPAPLLEEIAAIKVQGLKKLEKAPG